MIITTQSGASFDTEKDLTAAERHILQKLFIWKSMVDSLGAFIEKKEKALADGWNASGPVRPSEAMRVILDDLEKQVAARLKKALILSPPKEC